MQHSIMNEALRVVECGIRNEVFERLLEATLSCLNRSLLTTLLDFYERVQSLGVLPADVESRSVRDCEGDS